jgi:hypothetical protein
MYRSGLAAKGKPTLLNQAKCYPREDGGKLQGEPEPGVQKTREKNGYYNSLRRQRTTASFVEQEPMEAFSLVGIKS